MLARRIKLAEMDQTDAHRAVANHQRGGIVRALRGAERPLGYLVARSQFGSNEVKDVSAVQRLEKLRRIPKPLTKLKSTRKSRTSLGRRPTSRRNESAAQRDLKIEFQPRPLRRLRQGAEKRQSARQLGPGLDHRRAPDS